uniref:Uncharacterized protein n=1 Tax=Sphaerodactylus townsendi TaxID=933632 RepID=A0ACB8F3I8_9SAUR
MSSSSSVVAMKKVVQQLRLEASVSRVKVRAGGRDWGDSAAITPPRGKASVGTSRLVAGNAFYFAQVEINREFLQVQIHLDLPKFVPFSNLVSFIIFKYLFIFECMMKAEWIETCTGISS